MSASGKVIEWLLDSDPAIRWQVMRDILRTSESLWAEERAKIEFFGWGAQLLAHQDEDGQWAGGSFVPRGFTPQDWRTFGQPWTATSFSLAQLRESRISQAVNHVRSKRQPDGTWLLDWSPKGPVWFEVDDGTGKPSKWLTLRAERVLKWLEEWGL